MLFTVPLLVLAGAASVSSMAVRRKTPPAGWWTEGLEPYDTYNARYLALGCREQHNTDFFTQCCHPLRKEESLSDRPAECTPGGDDSSDDDQDCSDDEPQSSPAPAAKPAPSAPAAAPAPAPPVNVAPAPAPAPAKPSPPPAPKPSPAPAPAPAPAPKPSPAPAPAPPPSSGNSQTGNGRGTFFFQNNNAGACGTVHSDNSKVVALDSHIYGNNCVGQSPLCGKTVTITNTNTGASVDALIADCCPTCETSTSIDMSVGAFTAIATEEEGDVPIAWTIHL